MEKLTLEDLDNLRIEEMNAEELRELHREEPENAEVTRELAMGLLNAFNHQSDPEKADELMKEFQKLHL